MKKMIRLILIGPVGGGKTSLGNFLFGQKIFDENRGISVPEIEEKRDNNLSIVDTPGFGYSNTDEKYKKLSDYIKSIDQLNGILIVMKAQDQRLLSSSDEEMMKNICNIFNFRSFKNIAFVFTHFYAVEEIDVEYIKNTSLEKVKLLKELIEKSSGGKQLEGDSEIFFINNLFGHDKIDGESIKVRDKILSWAKGLPSII